MIRSILKWLWRGGLALVLLALIALSPIAWIELACRGEPVADDYRPIITDPAERRAESRTLLTYPEWHIVHAYDDYARVIADGDPHDFGYIRAIRGFWSSLCALNRAAARHGGATTQTKMTIYTIGVSFNVEMAMKALYEETIGRAATWVRGEARAPLDDLSAAQAVRYAAFLQQVPWYKWDFRDDAAALDAAATDTFRDGERRFALGLEYRAKAAYAEVIEQAVGQVGADKLTLRSVVAGLPADELDAVEGVTVIAERPEGVEIETPRYRAFTLIAEALAALGGDFVEIAGNDDILLTALSDMPQDGALHAFARQGYGDTRNLLLMKVADLGAVLRGMRDGPMRLEHIHDY